MEECLQIFDGKCRIDLFQAARGDLDIPIEVTVGAIAEYVRAGKVGCIRLGECSANTIRRASAIHPIVAAELELSLFETGILKWVLFHICTCELSVANIQSYNRNGIAEACKEFNIAIVAYSPSEPGISDRTASPSTKILMRLTCEECSHAFIQKSSAKMYGS